MGIVCWARERATTRVRHKRLSPGLRRVWCGTADEQRRPGVGASLRRASYYSGHCGFTPAIGGRVGARGCTHATSHVGCYDTDVLVVHSPRNHPIVRMVPSRRVAADAHGITVRSLRSGAATASGLASCTNPGASSNCGHHRSHDPATDRIKWIGKRSVRSVVVTHNCIENPLG